MGVLLLQKVGHPVHRQTFNDGVQDEFLQYNLALAAT